MDKEARADKISSAGKLAVKDELAETRDDSKETQMDKLHKENVKEGGDKYKTLSEIREGNTKRRVDAFESM